MTETKSNTNTVKKIIFGLAIFVLILVLCPMTTVQAEEQLVEVGIPVEEYPHLFLPRSMPTHGEGKIAVFLIQFPDYMNDNPEATQEYYDKLYFSGGVDLQWKTTVADFFEEQSYGKLKIGGQVFDWYTAKHERSYYDYRKAELIIEAAEYYQAQGVDFSQFDGDGDGEIDAIVFHFAGEYSTDNLSDDPWYNGVCYGASTEHGSIAGLKFKTIVQIYDGARSVRSPIIETCCHELMHTLGMPDLYGKTHMAMVNTNDLMSQNKRTINPYLKMLLGWIDSVRVYTSDADDVRLEVYDSTSHESAVIVTDEYNGLFGEFYLVAYRDFEKQKYPVIWHIDARLNSTGTAFLNDNLYFEPRPDKENVHGVAISSPYLFIEELSADPSVDYVLNQFYLTPDRIFGKGSVFGPNSVPSSDTHDGNYTGILIQNILEHNEEYLTFDVSFVNDTDSPKVVTEDTALEFQNTIKIQFNEYVYEGESWDDIRITDMTGAPLEATIILPHYPRHEVEITFQTQDYEDGYTITFPEGSLRDSSGNSLSETTLTASKENYLYPICEEQLPNPGYKRDNSKAHFFHEENSLVVITSLWVDAVESAKVEFMRLDANGNVLVQNIVENPFKGSDIDNVVATGNGCYVFFCTAESNQNQWTDLIFCIDQNGQLKWANESFYNTGYQFYGYESYPLGDGLITRIVGPDRYDAVFIRAEDGTVEDTSIQLQNKTIALSNEKLLRHRIEYQTKDQIDIIWELVEAETFEVENQIAFVVQDSYDYYLQQAYANEDGTMLVYYWLNDNAEVLLLDTDFSIVKSIVLERVDADSNNLCWFESDGFCEIDRREEADHDNFPYHVRRYDRHLNLLWETDLEANFVYFFKSDTGDIMAYRSIWAPKRECYIDDYGSEEKFRTQHVHTIEYREATSSTCASEGRAEHWYCTECGVYFSDNGETIVTDLNAFSLPLGGHTYGEWSTTEHATCTKDGVKTRKCLYCDDAETEAILANGEHSYGEWSITQNATCNEDGVKTRKCRDCEATETETIPATGMHSYGDWSVVKNASCTEDGVKTRKCLYCDDAETETIPATGVHSFGDWSVTKNASCSEDGIKTRKCRNCEATEVETIVSTDAHIFGNWETTKYATCTEAGEERRACQNCNYKMIREIRPTGKHEYGGWVITEEATCKTEGQKKHTCDFCGGTETQVIPANDQHLYGEWLINKKVGEETRTCTRCGAEEARSIPKDYTPIIVIGIGAVVVLGGVSALLFRKKRK